MTTARPASPPRRHVRVRCLLDVQGNQIEAHSTNLSSTELYLRVAKSESKADALAVGGELRVKFYLPRQIEPLQVNAEITALDPSDVDIAGQPAVGVGIRLRDVGEHTARIARFIDDFRHTVMLISEDPQTDELRPVLEEHYRVLPCMFGADALDIMGYEEVAAIVVDGPLRDMGATELFERAGAELPRSHVVAVIMGGDADGDVLRTLGRVGKPFYYLRKPMLPADVRQFVSRAVDTYALAVENERLSQELQRSNRRLERENSYLRQRIEGLKGFEDFVGSSQRLREALSELERIRRTEATVYIRGETGTGKELAARAVHFGGPRAKGPFVAQNCGGMTESLLQSTLFGYRRGAFTGADRDRPGVFQEAHNGTLFLDEVAELAAPMQASLLRVLQSQEVTPVGATRPEKVNVRVISATHKDLRAEVLAGRFREDLYFRLVVITVVLPPLRERVGDIGVLARHFLELSCARYGSDVPGFSEGAALALERYAWPGNVRELQNEVERLVVLGTPGEKIPLDLVSPHILAATNTLPLRPGNAGGEHPFETLVRRQQPLDDGLAEYERAILERALEKFAGNRSTMAKVLKIPRQTLLSRLKKLGLDEGS